MKDEDLKVVITMKEMGGSFVQALALCFMRADAKNFKKLKDAFPEYWKQYTEMSQRKHGIK